MTALAKSKPVAKRGDLPVADQFELPVLADAVIYAGGMTAVDTDGYAQAAIPGVALTAVGNQLRIIGRAEEEVDATGYDDGDLTVKVRRGVFELEIDTGAGALTIADIGDRCYLKDDQTASRSSALGLYPELGTVIGFEGGRVFVEVGTQPPKNEYHLIAGEDLTAAQYLFVVFDNTAKVVLAGAGENAIGVLQNAPDINELAIVKFFGLTKVKASGNLTPGAALASDAAGKAKAAVAGTVAGGAGDPEDDALVGSYVLGDLIGDAAADNDVVFMNFCRQGAIPTTAA
jgi:hypothetical protein